MVAENIEKRVIDALVLVKTSRVFRPTKNIKVHINYNDRILNSVLHKSKAIQDKNALFLIYDQTTFPHLGRCLFNGI